MRSATNSWNGRKFAFLVPADFVAIFVIIFSAFVDLPNLIRIGPISASSVVYASCALLLLVLVLAKRKIAKTLITVNIFLLLQVVWISFSLIMRGIQKNGVQNYFAIVFFSIAILFGGQISYVNTQKTFFFFLKKGVALASVISGGIALVNVVIYGWGSSIVGARWFVGPRSISMFALVLIAWHLGEWTTSQRRQSFYWTLFWLLVIFVSLSRMAIFSSLMMFAVALLLNFRISFMRLLKVFAIYTFVAISLLATVLFPKSPLHDRIFSGDRAFNLLGVQINTAGRLRIWKVVWESVQGEIVKGEIVIGKGIGSSEILVKNTFHTISHPHNDYLRILHDLGVVGLFLWLFQIFIWGKVLISDIKKGKPQFSPHQHLRYSALLILLGFVLVMLTDNIITYLFFLMPFGVLLGSAVMAGKRLKDSVNLFL